MWCIRDQDQDKGGGTLSMEKKKSDARADSGRDGGGGNLQSRPCNGVQTTMLLANLICAERIKKMFL
jgi:hypothetical protein